MSDSLTLQIYSTGTTPIYDVGGELLNGRDLWWETFFPAGKYGAGGVDIPREKANNWWEVKGTLRVVIRDGQKIVYEGKLPSLVDRMSETDEGVQVNFMGLWGYDLASKTWRKRWADDRTDEATWPLDLTVADGGTTTKPELAFIDRRARFKFTPKAEAWGNGDFTAITYEMPYNQTIARVVYDINLQEGAQAWEISMWRSPDGSTWTQMDTNGVSGDVYNAGTTTIITASTGAFPGTPTSIDVEPNGTITHVQFRYYSRAAQTPTSDGAYFAAVTNLMVYSEDEAAANISLESVANDIVTKWTDILNSSTAFIHTPSTERSLEPFLTAGDSFEYLDSILMRAAAPGDGDDNRMSVGVLSSESVASPDGKPVLYTSEYPDVTAGHDFFIAPDSKNLVGLLKLTHDYDAQLFNFIPVEYRNKDGIRKYLDPNETTSLKDATSIGAYGERHLPLRLGNQTAATAQEIGEKWLAAKKDPPWLASQITVKGFILDDNGQPIPASRIEACDSEGVGKRLKVDGYDTFIISRVRNSLNADGSITATINIGPIADPLGGQEIFDIDFDDSVRDPGGDTGGGAQTSGGADLAERLGLTWLKKSDRPRYQQIKRRVQQYASQHNVNAKRALRKLGYGHLSRF